MPEIIEILSSPEAKKPSKTHARLAVLSSDDFNTSLFNDDDWLSSHPAKKRRSNPSVPAAEDELGFSKRQLRFDDEDDLPALKRCAPTPTSQKYIDLSLDEAFSDEITFSSSAPEARVVKRPAVQALTRRGVDENPQYLDDEIFSFSQPPDTSKHLSERTANLLANMTTRNLMPERSYSNSTTFRTTTVNASSHSISTNTSEVKEDIFDSSPRAVIASGIRNPVVDKEAKAAARAEERVATKAAKETAKEEERKQKRLAREQKAREKQHAADIAEVNKAKWDKKISTPEMILHLPRSLEDSSVNTQLLEYMKRLEVETCIFDSDISPGNVIKWKREVKAEFDEEEGQWKPITKRIEDENHVLCHLQAGEFVELVLGSTTQSPVVDEQDLQLHVGQLNSRYPNSRLIYLIEGLAAWMRKNRNTRNRAYQDAVHGQARSVEGTSNPRKRKKGSAVYIDEDAIEDALLQLQVNHECLIYQTSCPSDSAEWIKNFTEHVSTIPYRQERMNAQNDAAFCMDVGQVRTGDNALDTYVRMLQEVNRLTPAMAYGIANLYPNIRSLTMAFKQRGPALLEDVKKSANKNGGVTEARLGPAISKRLYKVLLGTNPSSTDV